MNDNTANLLNPIYKIIIFVDFIKMMNNASGIWYWIELNQIQFLTYDVSKNLLTRFLQRHGASGGKIPYSFKRNKTIFTNLLIIQMSIGIIVL